MLPQPLPDPALQIFGEIAPPVFESQCPGVGGDALAFRHWAPNSASARYTPNHNLLAGSLVVTAPNGRRFFAPPHADFRAVYRYGKALGALDVGFDFGILWAHAFGAPFDFQRIGNQFFAEYAYAANYAIGIDFAAAHRPVAYSHMLAKFTQAVVSGGHGSGFAAEAITQGYIAGARGACGR